MKMDTKQLEVWDFTIPSACTDVEQIRTSCTKGDIRYCFQMEKGESGYEHYQGRIHWPSRVRLSTLINWKKKVGLDEMHFSPTCKANKDNNFYVMKDETRIDGPWMDTDTAEDEGFNYIQKRFRGTQNWRAWQQTILDMIDAVPDDRTVNVIIDKVGGSGKTYLTMYLMSHGKAWRVPQQKDARDIARCIMGTDPHTCYFIDFPRAISSKDQNSCYAAIEEIKNGYCYDDRYKFKQRFFEPPHVWVFTNSMPDTSLLSKDRWNFWTVRDNKLLKIIPTKRVNPDDDVYL